MKLSKLFLLPLKHKYNKAKKIKSICHCTNFRKNGFVCQRKLFVLYVFIILFGINPTFM